MSDEPSRDVFHAGSGVFHPTHVDTQATGNSQVPRATGDGNVQKLSDNIQVVEFLLGDEHFAVDLFEVREVVEYTRITHLPNTPSHIRGIIDLRGEITTIIDLKNLMHIQVEKKTDEATSRIIVLDDRITKSKIGIMVDDVLSVSTFSRKDVDTSAASVNRELNNIIGIIRKKIKVKDKDDNELIIWIDILRLLKEVDQEILKQGNGEETEAGE